MRTRHGSTAQVRFEGMHINLHTQLEAAFHVNLDAPAMLAAF